MYEPANPEGCSNFYNETWICERAESFADEPGVNIEPNGPIWATGCQRGAPWHLDYISHKDHRRESKAYPYTDPQPQTTVYVLDTWIDIKHPEFEGRASHGASFIGGQSNGHGTHVAGLIAGKQYGVNKRAKIVGVQVLDDQGLGSWAVLVRGLEWLSKQKNKGIVNISIGGSPSDAVDGVIKQLVDHGWKIVVAAGNEASDACGTTPARSAAALTVGATNKQNRLAQFSNYGKCVNILAPGEAITSAYPNGQYAMMSGTSMASPIVAGVWSTFPKWTREQLLQKTGHNTIGKPLPPGTPNLFVYAENNERCLFSVIVIQ